jgi:hypothetical protein
LFRAHIVKTIEPPYLKREPLYGSKLHNEIDLVDVYSIDNPTKIEPAKNPDYVPLIQPAGPDPGFRIGI